MIYRTMQVHSAFAQKYNRLFKWTVGCKISAARNVNYCENALLVGHLPCVADFECYRHLILTRNTTQRSIQNPDFKRARTRAANINSAETETLQVHCQFSSNNENVIEDKFKLY